MNKYAQLRRALDDRCTRPEPVGINSYEIQDKLMEEVAACVRGIGIRAEQQGNNGNEELPFRVAVKFLRSARFDGASVRIDFASVDWDELRAWYREEQE